MPLETELEKERTLLDQNGPRLLYLLKMKVVPDGPSRIWFKFLKTLKLVTMFCHSVGIVKNLLKFGIHVPSSKLFKVLILTWIVLRMKLHVFHTIKSIDPKK